MKDIIARARAIVEPERKREWYIPCFVIRDLTMYVSLGMKRLNRRCVHYSLR